MCGDNGGGSAVEDVEISDVDRADNLSDFVNDTDFETDDKVHLYVGCGDSRPGVVVGFGIVNKRDAILVNVDGKLLAITDEDRLTIRD